MSKRAWAYIGIVLLTGALLTAMAIPGMQNTENLLITFGVLTALATVSQLYETSGTHYKWVYYPHYVFFFAGCILLHPSLYVGLVAIPHLIEWAKKRLTHSPTLNKWYIQPFNISTHIIAGLTARVAYQSFEHNTWIIHTPIRVFIVLGVALLYVLIQHFLISLALFLARGLTFNQSALMKIDSLLPDVFLAALGYIVALLWDLDNWLIILALCPLVMMYEATKVPALRQEAQTDSKTGLLNARHFNKVFTTELERARRFSRPLSLIMADLDFMRNVNNTYGHLAGDKVLASVAQTIRDTVREYDHPGRFGGEEFAIVLPEVNRDEALVLAERLRNTIENTPISILFNGQPKNINVTMSIGVACFPYDATTLTNLINAADVAVYHAKHIGRNQVVYSADVPQVVIDEYIQVAPTLPNIQVEDGIEETVNIISQTISESKAEPDKVYPGESGFDQLTRLHSRQYFINHLEQSLIGEAQGKTTLAVLLLDLDRFKMVNESLGHELGDRLLVETAKRLKTCLRADDLIARMGGDEFIILLRNLTPENSPARVADRILTLLQTPFELGPRKIFVSTSIGIVLTNRAYRNPVDVWRDADIAMYQAKSKGRSCYATFDSSMNDQVHHHFELEGHLRHALNNDEFEVYYQPMIELANQSIQGMEALLRWRHPIRGLVSPAEFIPLAEETGLIRPIGRWVLEQACQQAKQWHITHPSLLVSVNLSGRQIQQPDELIEMVTQVLTKTGVDPAVIQLEITESVLMDDTRANISTLNRLKALGVRLAIDDFGTGYSSLSYLKWFPVDSIKIDRAFISGIATDVENRAVVKAVLGLGSDLALSVVAEGVENTEELDHLSLLGCRFTQGYFFARPMPSTEANKLLEQGLLPSSKIAEVKPARVINLGSDDYTFHYSAI